MGMFDNDIIYGGEQLEPSVVLDAEYVLWDAGIVARNVETSLGTDGVKCEVIISQVQGETRSGDQTASVPAAFGTYASSIVSKIERKQDGDLPAVVKFQKIPPKDAAKQEAFVMTFVRKWDGENNPPAAALPALSPFIDNATTAPPNLTTVKDEGGRKTTTIGGRKFQGDPTGADHPLG